MAGTSERYEYSAGESDWTHAMLDLRRGFAKRSLWLDMAVRQFKGQYRGTIIGPFWISVTTAMTATGLGLLYAKLFQNDIATHLPYVTISVAVWALISGYATAGASVFSGSAHVFQEYPLPISVFMFRLMANQAMGFFFRLIVVLAVLMLFGHYPDLSWGLALLGLALLFWIGFWFSAVFGILHAYFRDFGQLLGSLLTFIFFMTPIFWRADRLGDYAFIIDYNPFYHLLQIVRGPLLGEYDGLGTSFAVAGAIALVAPALGLLVYGRFSRRLPYWC